MAKPTAAALAALLKGDNRTVVGSKDPDTADKVAAFTDLGPTGTEYGLDTASTATAAAYSEGADPGTLKIVVPEGNGKLTKNDLRTQYFHVAGTYDATKVGFGAKLCFVNSKGQPLKADGTPADSVTAAVDASTTDLTSLGEAVTNWSQCQQDRRLPYPASRDVPGQRAPDEPLRPIRRLDRAAGQAVTPNENRGACRGCHRHHHPHHGECRR